MNIGDGRDVTAFRGLVAMLRGFGRMMRDLVVLAGLALALAPAGYAQEKPASFETIARQAVLLDYDTRSVLFERDADQKIAPGSLVKIMTAAIIFREISEGRLKLDGDMVVSTEAWRRGGAVSGTANMLLTPNKVVKVQDLLTGLVVGSANDAAIALAENVAGTEARFAAMMNAHARELGLSAEFRNATGFAAEGQEASLRDLSKIAAHIIEKHPDLYALFGQKDMPFGKNRQVNRNPLVALEIGADGLMTASVPEQGHLIVGSSVQEGRRIIVALAGLETLQERTIEARKLLEWGFRRFEIRSLFPEGTVLGEVSVYGGATASVPVKARGALRLPVLRGSGAGVSLELAWRGPVPAPIAEGQEIARLRVIIDGRLIQEAPLVAAAAVAKGSVLGRAQDAALELSRQWAASGFRWVLEKVGLAGKGDPKQKNAPKDQLSGKGG